MAKKKTSAKPEISDIDDGDVPEPPQGLSDKEERTVEESLALRAAVIYEIIRVEGEGELARRAHALWWSGLAAGISIGFSFLAQAVIASHLPDAPWRPLIDSFGYSVGFLIVILGRQQLFTESTLTAVLPVVARREVKWVLVMLRLWGIVLAANLVGGFIFAAAFSYLDFVSADVRDALRQIAEHLMANDPSQMFVKGIAAGWLIAALVWMLPSARDVEFLVITVLTYLIALGGFTHVIAGSAEAFYGWFTGVNSLFDVIFVFLLPTLAGNVVGGTALFAVLSYAQVRREIQKTKSGNHR